MIQKDISFFFCDILPVIKNTNKTDSCIDSRPFLIGFYPSELCRVQSGGTGPAPDSQNK